MPNEFTIREAAAMLGEELEQRFPYVVGVSLHPSGDQNKELMLYIDIKIDHKGVPPRLPRTYKGFTVHYRWVGDTTFCGRV